MDINQTMMMFFQAAQSSNAASLTGRKGNKESFESLLNQKANEKDAPSKAEQTTNKKPEDLKNNGTDKESVTDQKDTESLLPENVPEDFVAENDLGNSELLAAMLLHHNDWTAALQSLQTPNEVPTEVVVAAPVQTVAAEEGTVGKQPALVQTENSTTTQNTDAEAVVPKATEAVKQPKAHTAEEQPQLVSEQKVVKEALQALQADHTVVQKKAVEPRKHVVIQDGAEQTQDEIPKEIVMESKPLTPVEEMRYVKVADVVSVEKGDVAEQLADQILMKKQNVFELQLDPMHLGKIQVKVSFEHGETTVSILCASQKAMEVLSDNKASLIGLLENRMGQAANVQVHTQEEQDLFFQHDQQNNNKQEQRQEDTHQQKQRQDEDTNSFLQQLRLGLA